MAGRNVLDTKKGRLSTFGVLYVSEGIPLGFAAVAMAAYMRREGMDVAQVGAFVAAFYLPWAFKWAWAPLVDLVGLKRFGGRKAWIVLCQTLMILTLYAIAQIDHSRYFDLLITLVIVHNVFAATISPRRTMSLSIRLPSMRCILTSAGRATESCSAVLISARVWAVAGQCL
jgi:PAT family beta-lactamase induction signal transducer AmpG